MKRLLIALATLSLLLSGAGCAARKPASEPQSAAPRWGMSSTANPHGGTAPGEAAEKPDPHAGMTSTDAPDPHAGPGATDPHAGMGATNPHAGTGATEQAHTAMGRTAPKVEAPAPGSLAKTADGTIAEIYGKSAGLKGKKVSVRGKVVKFLPLIMERNWIHLQDGSGDKAAGTGDLTVTSTEEVAPGDVVVATGTLAADKDFGMGYTYKVILENGHFTKEK